MNNADLVWHLVQLLLQKDKDFDKVESYLLKNDQKPNDQK